LDDLWLRLRLRLGLDDLWLRLRLRLGDLRLRLLGLRVYLHLRRPRARAGTSAA
jgi:hypothetical protein